MNLDIKRKIEKELASIDFQKFNIFGYSVKILKDQGIKGSGSALISEPCGLIINSYYRKEITEEEFKKRMNQVFEKHSFDFNWEKFPNDIQEIRLEKLLRCKQIENKIVSSEFNNKNMIEVFDNINKILNSQLDHRTLYTILFSKWKKQPSIYVKPYWEDFILGLLSFRILDPDCPHLKKMEEALELTQFERIELDVDHYLKNFILFPQRIAS